MTYKKGAKRLLFITILALVIVKPILIMGDVPVQPRIFGYGIVTSSMLSPDGKTIVIASKDRYIRIWEVSTQKLIKELGNTPEDVQIIQYSSKGTKILTVEKDWTVRLWDLNSGAGRVLRKCQANQYAISPNDSMWLSVNDSVSCWNIESGEVIKTFSNLPDSVIYSDFKGNNEVVIATRDKLVKIWNISTGNIVRSIPGGDLVAISANGTKLLIAGNNNLPVLRDAETGDSIRTIGNRVDASTLAINSNGSKIAIISNFTNSTTIWNGLSGDSVSAISVSYETMSDSKEKIVSKFSDDGTMLYTNRIYKYNDNNDYQSATVWNTENNTPLRIKYYGMTISACFSLDGKNVFGATHEGFSQYGCDSCSAPSGCTFGKTIQAWQISNTERINLSEIPKGFECSDLITGPDSQSIIAGYPAGNHTAGVLYSINFKSNKTQEMDVNFVNGISQAKNGLLVIGTRNETSPESHAVLHDLNFIPLKDFGTGYGVFSRDGSRLLIYSSVYSSFSLYETSTLSVIREYQSSRNASCSSDGSKILVWNKTADTAILWDVNSNSQKLILTGYGQFHNFYPTFSANGDKLLLAGPDGGLNLYDIITDTLIKKIPQCSFGIFLDNDRKILTDSNTVIDISSGLAIKSFSIPGKKISNPIISPDGKSLLHYVDNGTVAIWDISELQTQVRKNMVIPCKSTISMLTVKKGKAILSFSGKDFSCSSHILVLYSFSGKTIAKCKTESNLLHSNTLTFSIPENIASGMYIYQFSSTASEITDKAGILKIE